jgi:regulator of sigma E protease
MPILIFIAVLFVLVLVHEFGHFITAKWSKMRVDEFAIGFPPRIFSWKKGETAYSLNALPLGGYVRIYGENGEDAETPDTPRAFAHRPKYLQAIVLVAGVTMNILLAFVLYTTTYLMGVTVSIPEEEKGVATELVVASVVADSPAQEAGVQTGDRILSLAAADGDVATLVPSGIASFIKEREGELLTLGYRRDAAETSVALTPRMIEAPDGARAARVGFVTGLVEERTYPFSEAVQAGASDTWYGTLRIAEGIGTLLARTVKGEASMNDVTGPIGIAGLVGDASKFGFSAILTFTAFISLNLAVINMLPIPALDGGRLVMVGIEALIRRPLNQRFVAGANLAGFALLMLLMLVVTVGDISRLFK